MHGSNFKYLGGDLNINNTSTINVSLSAIKTIETCSTTHSVNIDGINDNNNNNAYDLNLSQTKLKALYGNNLIVYSQKRSIFINGIIQNERLSVLNDGQILFASYTASAYISINQSTSFNKCNRDSSTNSII